VSVMFCNRRDRGRIILLLVSCAVLFAALLPTKDKEDGNEGRRAVLITMRDVN
jgi:hypothetical protein